MVINMAVSTGVSTTISTAFGPPTPTVKQAFESWAWKRFHKKLVERDKIGIAIGKLVAVTYSKWSLRTYDKE